MLPFKYFVFWVSSILGKIRWDFILKWFNHGKYYKLKDEDLSLIRKYLSSGHYIILTRRNTHLSTYLISLAGLFLLKKPSYWSHALLNLEGDVNTDEDFRLVEATGIGVHYSEFMKVFDCDSIALLMPRNYTEEEWENALHKAATLIGKPYDTLYDLMSDSKISCVELVRSALMANGDYAEDFKKLETMIKKKDNLVPQMFYDCNDFERVLVIKR